MHTHTFIVGRNIRAHTDTAKTDKRTHTSKQKGKHTNRDTTDRHPQEDRHTDWCIHRQTDAYTDTLTDACTDKQTNAYTDRQRRTTKWLRYDIPMDRQMEEENNTLKLATEFNQMSLNACSRSLRLCLCFCLSVSLSVSLSLSVLAYWLTINESNKPTFHGVEPMLQWMGVVCC